MACAFHKLFIAITFIQAAESFQVLYGMETLILLGVCFAKSFAAVRRTSLMNEYKRSRQNGAYWPPVQLDDCLSAFKY